MKPFKLRRALVYLATGMFFTVAALTQVQGDSIPDVFVKASVSCGVRIVFGLLLVHVVEDASSPKVGSPPASRPAASCAGRRATREGYARSDRPQRIQ